MTLDDALNKRSHAYGDIAHREGKADQIRRLIEGARPLAGSHVLEVGAGSGVISRAMSRVVGAEGSVTAVDVVDERVVTEGYHFLKVVDARLPFEDGRFDIVISNHVIEHVGPRPAQLTHLQEIRRVLRDDGLLYLAAPNRWAVMEPHFRLPALSWLPRPLADRYVRAARRGTRYDCWPQGPHGLRALFAEASFNTVNLCPAAVRLAVARQQGALPFLVRVTPDAVLRRIDLLMPSLIVLATPATADAAA